MSMRDMNFRDMDFIEGGSGVLQQPDEIAPPMAELADDEPPPKPRSVWLLGALGALLLHAGCVALAFEHMQPEEEGADLGAAAIEVGIELAAPQRDPSDLPPGPDSDASQASPEVMEQKTEVEQTDLPKDTPTETDDPDRIVSPQESQKPPEEEAKMMTMQTAASAASIAAEATAMPSVETAQIAPKSTAPELGSGESRRRVRATWQKELVVHLDKHKRYPAERSGQNAEIIVKFVLDRTGHIVSAEITKSSGDAAFDNAALAMMKRSDPVPAPPPLIADEGLTFSVPVNFRIKGH